MGRVGPSERIGSRAAPTQSTAIPTTEGSGDTDVEALRFTVSSQGDKNGGSGGWDVVEGTMMAGVMG